MDTMQATAAKAARPTTTRASRSIRETRSVVTQAVNVTATSSASRAIHARSRGRTTTAGRRRRPATRGSGASTTSSPATALTDPWAFRSWRWGSCMRLRPPRVAAARPVSGRGPEAPGSHWPAGGPPTLTGDPMPASPSLRQLLSAAGIVAGLALLVALLVWAYRWQPGPTGDGARVQLSTPSTDGTVAPPPTLVGSSTSVAAVAPE